MTGMPFIADEMARGMAEMMRQRAAVDPAFAEDCESIKESMPYIIRYDGACRPVTCERCGTYVADLLESRADQDRRTRAIWEAQTARKHTLRRCNWLRDNGGIEATGWRPA